MEYIWLFHGEMGSFASAAFTDQLLAEEWIKKHQLINTGVYDWAINTGIFNIKREDHTTLLFSGKFSSASQDHYHYTTGDRF